jgi:hypothetical protein
MLMGDFYGHGAREGDDQDKKRVCAEAWTNIVIMPK